MTIPRGAYPLVQLMSSPDPGGEIFFDFNDGLSWPEHDGFTLGAPPLLGDPGGVGAEYGYRTLSFSLVVQGDEAEAMRQHTELARQLMRDSVYLRFQLSEQAPSVWFRCVRSSPGESSIANVYLDRYEQQWRIAVSLLADPFGIGERVTHQLKLLNDPVLNATVLNDPTFSGGLHAVFPDVRGDAPAPLNLELAPNTTPDTYKEFFRPWISVCPLEQSRGWPELPYAQAENAELGGRGGGEIQTGTAAALWSGQRRVRFRYIAPGRPVERLLTFPNMRPWFAGRWRAFIRVGFEAEHASPVTLTITGTGAAVSSPRTTVTELAASTLGEHQFMVDLGVYTFPKGNMPTSRPYTMVADEVGVDGGVTPGPDFGYTNLWFDYLVLVPVDLPLDAVGPVTTLDFQKRERTRSTVILRINSDDGVVQEVERSVDLGDSYRRGTVESPAGEFPMLTPGAKNVVTFLPRRQVPRSQSTVGSLGIDSVQQLTSITAWYRPRWLWMPGA